MEPMGLGLGFARLGMDLQPPCVVDVPKLF
jgi:hypothetical protein